MMRRRSLRCSSFRYFGVLPFVKQFLDFHWILPECHQGVRESDKQQWARIAHTALNTILQLVPMRCGGAEFVADKMVDKGVTEWNRILLSIDALPLRSDGAFD
jgi:hypothetical protein